MAKIGQALVFIGLTSSQASTLAYLSQAIQMLMANPFRPYNCPPLSFGLFLFVSNFCYAVFTLYMFHFNFILFILHPK